jgi:hypothetical protein
MTTKKTPNRFKVGMTLVEVVMVIGIYTVIMLVLTSSIVYLYQTNGYTVAQSYEIDHARRGLQAWLRDVKEMSYADDGTFPIAVMEPHRIGFYSDIDAEPSVEYVEYVLSSTTIYKYIYKATSTPPVYNLVTPVLTETLSEYVQNLIQVIPTFQYYDTDGGLLSSTSSPLTDVRYIEAKIIVNIDPLRSPGEFLLHSGISPRNLKDNL